MLVHNTVVSLSAAVTGLFVYCTPGGWWSFSFLHQLESIAYDARLNLTLPGTVDPRIVIVDIDERSLGGRSGPGPGRGSIGDAGRATVRTLPGGRTRFRMQCSPSRIPPIHFQGPDPGGPLGQDAQRRTELSGCAAELDRIAASPSPCTAIRWCSVIFSIPGHRPMPAFSRASTEPDRLDSGSGCE